MFKMLGLSLKVKMVMLFVAMFIFLGLALNLWNYQRIGNLLTARSTRIDVTLTAPSPSELLKERSVIRANHIANEKKLNEDLARVLRWMIASTILSAIVAGLIFYGCIGFMLGPLQKVISAVKAFGADKTSYAIPLLRPGDDVYELSVHVNNMFQRIDQALQLQRNFFASASHELKTPLAILRTQLEVGLAASRLTKETKILFTNQLEEIIRLQQIVTEFLVVSQLKAESLAIHKRPVDVSDLVLHIFSQLIPLLEKKRLHSSIVFEEDAGGFLINADEDLLRILFMNVIENATKYAVPGTLITCHVHRAPETEELILRFTNVTEDERVNTDRIRIAFSRSASLQEGAGLGIWLCDQIVLLHHGKMDVESGSYRFVLQIMLPT